MLLLQASFVALHARAAEFHVAVTGSDTNSGTRTQPWRTIQHAAERAQPGDIITVHEGLYRESINPPRGGTSDAKRIVYQAAPGERVEIKGSEVIANWVNVQDGIWSVTLSNSCFAGFNPYTNLLHGDWFSSNGPREHHTGAVYLNGDWLREAASLDEVLRPTGIAPLWFGRADPTNTTLWAQFKEVNPNKQCVEINVRQTVFYPRKPGINYLTVRGFILRQAATQWAPPTAEQMGLVGTHWSKGWIIESNTISHSKCAGIALGKYGDQWDNTSAWKAEGYLETIHRALTNGWNKQTIGGHLVRNNDISHCEQAGIVGSLGCSFSVVTGNTIHDIHVQRLFGGVEMAGIKFHGAIDVEISRNHIYRSVQGIWLDWMAQGARVSGNLLHDNLERDLFLEANHGPFLVDNNLCLSPVSLWAWSQGGAYIHNLFAGEISTHSNDERMTPFLKAHSTAIAGTHNLPGGDDRYFNNVFAGRGDLSPYDTANLPVRMGGNVFLKGAKSSKHEVEPLLKPEFDPTPKLLEKPDGFCLEITLDKTWINERTRKRVTPELLGKAKIPALPYENPDGSALKIDTDYFGKLRNSENPIAGPFDISEDGRQTLNIWPLASAVGVKKNEPTLDTQALVTIDTGALSLPYSPMIFGGFLEHFDHQVYGGVFEPGSPLSDKRGFRRDVIAALKELKVPVVRWPGGCYVSGYHWEAGVGKERKPTDDMAWGVIEPNTFGTDEYVELCRLLNWDPYICNNAGNGTVEEMRNWVEYCNGKNGKYAQLRKDNGAVQPLNVNLWSIGNENWGQHEIGYKPIEQWSPFVLEAAKAMKAADPRIQLTAAALPNREWTLPLLKAAGQYLDYISIHSYWLPLWEKNEMPDYLTCMMHSEGPEKSITDVIGVLEESGYRGKIKIAYDEWNLRGWHHQGFPRKAVQNYADPEVIRLIAVREKNDIAAQYTMADALFSASFFNACLRHSEDVGMANIAPLVNTRGPLYVHPKGIVKRTHFHAMAMYANELQPRVGKLNLKAGNLKQGDRKIPVMDAIATVNDSGDQWSIALVNRHPDQAVACTVKMKETPLDGQYEALVLAGDSPEAFNDIEHPDRVVPVKTKVAFTNGVANLPPHSLTLIHVSMKNK